MNKIYEKIQKLMALGSGTSYSAEAEAALKMAHDLMAANGITIEELDAAGRERELGKLGEWVSNEKAFKVWERMLATAMAKLFDCQMLVASANRKQVLKFIGREGNVRTAMSMFSWIRDKLWADARKKFVPYSASACISYCTGAAKTIYSRVLEMKGKDIEQGFGLVVADESMQYMRKIYPDVVSSKAKMSVRDSEAYNSGKRDGSNIGLNKQFGLKAIA